MNNSKSKENDSIYFSIIVPIYNVEKYLKKCIDSILAQKYTRFEVILVDDGSSDNCPQICDAYLSFDTHIKVIHQKNAGLVNARNTGLKAASGEYICYVDGDDWISENYLRIISEKISTNQHPDMVIFGAQRIFKDKIVCIPSGMPEKKYKKEELNKHIYPYMIYDCRKPFCNGLVIPVAWNKVYKTQILKNHYCTDERIRMGEDNAFVFECMHASDTILFINDELYYYNQKNENSMISTYDNNRFLNNRYLINYITEKMGGINTEIDFEINAFKAYWLIMAIFHEIKSGMTNREALHHISHGIKETSPLRDINIKELPLKAKCFIALLKCHMYYTAIIGARIVNSMRTESYWK